MTLKEIENTLETLTLRHESLSESTLVILLRAGGWDEKLVRDAVAIFRRNRNGVGKDGEREVFFPALQEEPVLPPEIDSAHLLPEHAGEESLVVPVSNVEEVANPVARPGHDDQDLPHNLPLKPFESTPHVWPFAKYKSFFYGDVPAPQQEPPHVEEAVASTGPVHRTHITLEPTPLSKDEHRLVVLAVCTFLAIVLFLGYMYSNGRL